jgi:hypothetical protein
MLSSHYTAIECAGHFVWQELRSQRRVDQERRPRRTRILVHCTDVLCLHASEIGSQNSSVTTLHVRNSHLNSSATLQVVSESMAMSHAMPLASSQETPISHSSQITLTFVAIWSSMGEENLAHADGDRLWKQQLFLGQTTKVY